MELVEVDRDYLRGAPRDRRSINAHSERTYRAPNGKLFTLSRETDADPPSFTAYGPYDETFRGLLPVLEVGGSRTWGEGMSWTAAYRNFAGAVEQAVADAEAASRPRP
jgi:hypothetical protein